jgi:hypothetical protein
LDIFTDSHFAILFAGLNYFHAHRFRSRAVIEFGSPITITPGMVEKFKAGGNEKREVCGKLLDIIYNALKSVTVNASSYETLMVCIISHHNPGGQLLTFLNV